MREFIAITPEDLKGNYDYKIEPGTSIPMCTCELLKNEEDCNCYYCQIAQTKPEVV